MIKLKIDNFGPIKHAELDFKKVNILIGQQGAGKSCILKIAAFCMWVEKVCNTGRHITQKAYIKKRFLEYFKLEDYVVVADSNYSEISYSGNRLKISFRFKKNEDNWVKIDNSGKPSTFKRVAYIPAERCLVSTIPNLLDIRLQDTCTLQYLVDWEQAHKYYNIKHRLDILDLNAEFYNDSQSNIDYLLIDDNNGLPKQIKFSNAASGFQSIVPICVLTNYYLNNDDTTSVREKLSDEHKDQLSTQGDCVLFLEEPEANLFPETQNNLVRWLFSALNNGFDNSLFIATHSPYILTAMNNLIYAAKVGEKQPSKIKEIISPKMWLSSSNVSAYYINEGTVLNIVDSELGEIDPELIDKISQTINSEYNQMRNIEYGTQED